MKNALAGRQLAAINPFVDTYNAVSLRHVLPAGADDLDRIAGNVRFRYAHPDDLFHDMAPAGGKPSIQAPKPGEVVYADAEKILCRRWNWRQDARSLVGPATRNAIVTLQCNGVGDLGAAVADLADALARYTGADVTSVIADKASPVVALVDPR